MSAAFEPEIGQIAFGTPWAEYAVPKYAVALFAAIEAEIARVVWNRDQAIWGVWSDPEVPGIVWHPFVWDDDDTEAAKPNFAFGEVELRWYKRPGRSMSCNRVWTAGEWTAWFDDVMAVIRAAEIGGDDAMI